VPRLLRYSTPSRILRAGHVNVFRRTRRSGTLPGGAADSMVVGETRSSPGEGAHRLAWRRGASTPSSTSSFAGHRRRQAGPDPHRHRPERRQHQRAGMAIAASARGLEGAPPFSSVRQDERARRRGSSAGARLRSAPAAASPLWLSRRAGATVVGSEELRRRWSDATGGHRHHQRAVIVDAPLRRGPGGAGRPSLCLIDMAVPETSPRCRRLPV